MRKNPHVSVAMATYNGGCFLRQQIESILNQTYQDFELIISDDGSRDDTIEILNQYAGMDDRICVILNSVRLGFVGNFERAVLACKGQKIFLSDQDDVWSKDKICILEKELDKALLVYSDAELIDEKGAVLVTSYNNIKKPYAGGDAVLALMNGNYITGCTMAFKKELLLDALPFPADLPHDYWLALVAAAKKSVVASQKSLTRYRQHSLNTIGARFNKREGRRLCLSMSKLEDKLSQAKAKQMSITRLLDLLYNKLDEKTIKMARNLVEYYSSYATKVFRFKAFVFFCSSHNKIWTNLKRFDVLRRAFSSVIGYRFEKTMFHLISKYVGRGKYD